MEVMVSIHMISVTSALFFGSLTGIRFRKADAHKRFGVLYVTSMILILFSGLAIYKGGTWNLTHYLALASSLGLTISIYAICRSKKYLHGLFMKISVYSLYLEVLAECYYRLL